MTSTASAISIAQDNRRWPFMDAFVVSGLVHAAIVGLALVSSLRPIQQGVRKVETRPLVPVVLNFEQATARSTSDPREIDLTLQRGPLRSGAIRSPYVDRANSVKQPTLASKQPARELATGDGDGVVSGEAEQVELATTEGQPQSTDTTNGIAGSGLGHASTGKTSGHDAVQSPGAPPSGAGSPDMGASLRAGIARVVTYPPQARRRGWQGTTRLRIASDPAKRTVDVSVVTSSGFECLDDAALRATRAALESLQPRAPVAMTLPVEFRLR